MSRLRRALGLPTTERRLLLTAYLLVWMMTLCLHTCRFHRTRRLAAWLARLLARIGRPQRPRCSPEVVGWAVAVAGRHVPGATCLAQALAAEVLLAMQGAAGTLHVGVVRGPDEGLEAHAWVECMGRTVIGGAVERYARLLSLDLPQALAREEGLPGERTLFTKGA